MDGTWSSYDRVYETTEAKDTVHQDSNTIAFLLHPSTCVVRTVRT